MRAGARIKLGIFLLAGLALLVAMFALFARTRPWESPDIYYVRVPDSVFGIEAGSGVHVRGVRVGSVARLGLFDEDYESVTLRLEVDEGTHINADAKAHLRMRGVTGVRVIDIYNGTADADALAPGSHIPYGRTLLDELQNGADDLVHQATSMMVEANRVMEQLSKFTAELDAQQLDAILDRTLGMTTRLENASHELERLIASSRPPLLRSLRQAGDTLATVEGVASELEQAAAGLDTMVLELRGAVRVNAGDLRATMANLREASQSLRQMSREVRQRPSRLLFGGPAPGR